MKYHQVHQFHLLKFDVNIGNHTEKGTSRKWRMFNIIEHNIGPFKELDKTNELIPNIINRRNPHSLIEASQPYKELPSMKED